MPRSARRAPAGFIFHCLNRGVGRRTLFAKDGDYAAFERVLTEALAAEPGVGLLAYCLMPNHWHLVLLPRVRGGKCGPNFCLCHCRHSESVSRLIG